MDDSNDYAIPGVRKMGDFSFSINWEPTPPSPPPREVTITIGGEIFGLSLYAQKYVGEITRIDFDKGGFEAMAHATNLRQVPVEWWRRALYHVVGRPVFAIRRLFNGY